MKALIFSDSHGDSDAMRDILRMHPDAELVCFLGDGLRDFEVLPLSESTMRLYVRGNCDFTGMLDGILVKKVETVCLLGKTITLTHGDLYGAKYGIGGLLSLAEETSADIVLFGHTHTPFSQFEYIGQRGVHLFNPGSVSGFTKTYGILTLTEGKEPLFSHGTLSSPRYYKIENSELL